ncbi:hypothetical protein D3C87_277570 [compost metagenome]
MKALGRIFLQNTNGGLEIFEKYVKNQFTIDVPFQVDDLQVVITWNENYGNYAMYIRELRGSKWITTERYNAIWFVKEKFGLSEDETYLKINQDMNLDLIAGVKSEVVEIKKRPLITI